MNETTPKLPANVRTMVAIVASPTLLVIYFLLHSLLMGNWSEIGVSTILFSALGCFAYYLVFAGKLPSIRIKQH